MRRSTRGPGMRFGRVLGAILGVLMVAVAAPVQMASAEPTSPLATAESPFDWSQVTRTEIEDIAAAMVIEKINTYRANAGTAPLPVLARFNTDSKNWSTHMAETNNFAHDSLSPWGTQQGDVTIGIMGENIAMFGPVGRTTLASPQMTAELIANRVFMSWKTSTMGHNEAMLNGDFEVFGMGIHLDAQNYAWATLRMYSLQGDPTPSDAWMPMSAVTAYSANPDQMLLNTEYTQAPLTQVGTPIAAVPGLVLPPAPSVSDLCATRNDTYTVPFRTGIEYRVNGVTAAAGTFPTNGETTVVVGAGAQPGYMMWGGPKFWTLSFDTTTHCYSFSDVPADNSFADEIYWLADNGISTGYADGRFGVGDNVLREQMAAFLHRSAGTPAVDATNCHTFADVPAGSGFNDAICWLKQQGITTGYSPTQYGYGDVVLREQMAAFIYRAAGSPAVDVTACHTFADVPAGSGFNDAICWMKQQGITTGYSPTEYGYGDPVLREQMAAFLYRWHS